MAWDPYVRIPNVPPILSVAAGRRLASYGLGPYGLGPYGFDPYGPLWLGPHDSDPSGLDPYGLLWLGSSCRKTRSLGSTRWYHIRLVAHLIFYECLFSWRLSHNRSLLRVVNTWEVHVLRYC